MRLTQWFDELRSDLTFALRQLRGSPAFTLVATLTLALGIGANSAIFALVDATLLRPLPYGNPDRLVSIWEKIATVPQSYASPLNLLDWQARSRTFENIAGFTPSVGGMVMAGADGNAETVSRQWVTSAIFDVLGVKPIAGRAFSAQDEATRANVIVISEAFWRTRFNADPGIVGREIRFDGILFTVIGIVPKDFQILGQTSIWAMRSLVDVPPRARGAYVFQVVGRLKPEASIEAAEADLAAVAARLAEEYPQTNKGRGITVERLHDTVIGTDLRSTSMLFLGVVGFVLLICCANVANLLLARATVRTRELAVRSALGAGRRRVVRQLLTEALVLAVIGGSLGAAIGAAILSVAPALVPEGMLPASVALTFDVRVAAFCAAAAIVVGLVFGVMPAWKATAFSTAEVIGSDTRTTTGSGGRLRGLLVTGEVAMAVFLLAGAGLLLRTLLAVEDFDRGYRAGSVLSMLVDPLGSKYPTAAALEQSGDAEALAPSIRAAISRVDKEQLVSVRSVMTLDAIARTATGRHRFRAVMVMAFAILALILAMVGVFGILAYSVQQSVRDFGLRRALGASTNDVLRLVLTNALRVVGTGAAIGLVLAAMSGRLIETLLFGVRPLDPTTFALVTVVLTITAALSIAAPAWRAARIDPATALRSR